MANIKDYIKGYVHPIRGCIFDKDEIVDIKEFEIINEKDNKFISTNNDRELCLGDFQYFIIPSKVMEGIIVTLMDDAYDKGLEDGKKKIKKKSKTTDE